MTFEEHWEVVGLRKKNEDLESENFDLREENYELNRRLEEYYDDYMREGEDYD